MVDFFRTYLRLDNFLFVSIEQTSFDPFLVSDEYILSRHENVRICKNDKSCYYHLMLLDLLFKMNNLPFSFENVNCPVSYVACKIIGSGRLIGLNGVIMTAIYNEVTNNEYCTTILWKSIRNNKKTHCLPDTGADSFILSETFLVQLQKMVKRIEEMICAHQHDSENVQYLTHT